MTYLTAGYPAPGATGPLLDRLAAEGADIIELGIPFSDPLADGPTIQRASHRAIEAGATLRTTLDELAAFRARSGTAVVLFSYLNPVLAYGIERFLVDAAAAGADGLLLTDLALGSDPALEERFEAGGLPLIRLIAPTTPAERAARIARRAEGFIYYISRTGVTGESATLREGIGSEVAAIREHTDAPIAVGFGISSPEQAAEVAGVADGIIVGSALINALDRGGEDEMGAFVRSLRRALDEV